MPDFIEVESKETGNKFLIDKSNLNKTLTVVDETPDEPKTAARGKKED